MNRHKNIRWKMKQLKKKQKQMLKEWRKDVGDVMRKELPQAVSIDTVKKVKAFLKTIEDQE